MTTGKGTLILTGTDHSPYRRIMKFAEFARICEEIEGISGRLEMIDALSRILPTLDSEDLPIFVQFVTGKIFPDWSPLKLGIGPNLLYDAITLIVDGTRSDVIREINQQGDIGLAVQAILEQKKMIHRSSRAPTIQTSLFSEALDLSSVYQILEKIARQGGRASQQEKLSHIRNLFQNASPLEGRYLARLLMEDLRIGVGEGTIRDAIARAFSVDPTMVEHAYQARNDLGEVAILAKAGERALAGVHIMPFHPVKMMLAQQGAIDVAIAENGPMAAEFKYDGSRFQFHKAGTESRLYSRKLEEVTGALPDILELLSNVTPHDVILDGEVIAIRDGKPLPFQTVLRRFRRKYAVDAMQKEVEMRPFVFDILYLDGETLIDLPFSERRARLVATVADFVTPQLVSGDPAEVDKMYRDSLAAGHEGLMLKVLSSPYTPGIRGKNWLKIKPSVDTLDLAVIGAEWGEGKRAHIFGSFLLACQDQGELVPLSKVATGFSDEQLGDLYEIFKDHVISEKGKEVQLEPFLVFEVGYSEIQESPNYGGGYALRFPRFIRIREDKGIQDVEHLDSIRDRYTRQGVRKAG